MRVQRLTVCKLLLPYISQAQAGCRLAIRYIPGRFLVSTAHQSIHAAGAGGRLRLMRCEGVAPRPGWKGRTTAERKKKRMAGGGGGGRGRGRGLEEVGCVCVCVCV